MLNGGFALLIDKGKQIHDLLLWMNDLVWWPSIVTTFVKKMEHIFILSSFLQVASTFRVTWCESSLMEPRIQSLSWNLHLMSSELSTCVLKTQMKINGEELTLVLFTGLVCELVGWPACLLSTRNSNPCDLALSTPVSV